jgi:hypothetical protein
VVSQIGEGCGVQQIAINNPTSSKRPKKLLLSGKLSDQRLRPRNFSGRVLRWLQLPKLDMM